MSKVIRIVGLRGWCQISKVTRIVRNGLCANPCSNGRPLLGFDCLTFCLGIFGYAGSSSPGFSRTCVECCTICTLLVTLLRSASHPVAAEFRRSADRQNDGFVQLVVTLPGDTDFPCRRCAANLGKRRFAKPVLDSRPDFACRAYRTDPAIEWPTLNFCGRRFFPKCASAYVKFLCRSRILRSIQNFP